MKKPIRFLTEALKAREENFLPDAVTGQNDETLVVFEEKEKKNQEGKGLCAFSLFNVFTADIIQQNTLFTR
jgi:hypothetical protein